MKALVAVVLAAALLAPAPAAQAQTNNAPTFSNSTATRSVAENSTNGTEVGTAITATDADSDTLTYSVEASATDNADDLTAFNESFSLNSSTGQITVRDGSTIDFETRTAYVVKYVAEDTSDAEASLTLTVNVSNVIEPPVLGLDAAVAAVGTALTATLTDSGSFTSIAWQWSRSAQPYADFTDISGAASAAYTPVSADVDYFLKVTVSYNDGTDDATMEETTSLPTGGSEEKLAANSSSNSAPANFAREQGVTFVTGDNPAGYLITDLRVNCSTSSLCGTRRYLRTGDCEANYNDETILDDWGRNDDWEGAGARIEPNTTYTFVVYSETSSFGSAPLLTKADRGLDADSKSGWMLPRGTCEWGGTTRVLIWTPFSGPGSTLPAQAEIRGVELLGPPGPPADLTAEAGTAGAADLSWTAPGSTGRRELQKYEVRHKVEGGSFGNWTDVPDSEDTGTSTADETSTSVSGLAFGTSHVIEVRAVNSFGAGSAAEVAFRNDTSPEFPAATTARSIDENSAAGTEVTDPATMMAAAVAASDADGDALTYKVVAVGASQAQQASITAFNQTFDLEEATGKITLSSGASLDFEDSTALQQFQVRVTVTDGEDSSGVDEATPTVDDRTVLTIRVNNVDEPGAVAITGALTVGSTLTAALSDPDGPPSGGSLSPTWQWSRSSTETGAYTAITGATSASYTITTGDRMMYLRATASYSDGQGTSKTAQQTVNQSGNQQPTFASPTASLTVVENRVSGTVGSPVTATDADGDALTYTIEAAAGEADDKQAFDRDFEIGASSGQVSVKSTAMIDSETRSTYKVVVAASDGRDSSDSPDTAVDARTTLTVSVTDADDAGTVALSVPVLRTGQTVSASLTDQDGPASGQTSLSPTWQWASATSATGPFSNIPSATSSSYLIDASDRGRYLRATAAYTDSYGSATAAGVTSSAVPNVDPTFGSATASRSILVRGTGAVGRPVSATDVEGDTLTYSLEAPSGAEGVDLLQAFEELFELDSSSGQVSVVSGATLTQTGSYRAVVTVRDDTDSDHQPDTSVDARVDLTVTVRNPPPPPPPPPPDDDGATGADGDGDRSDPETADGSAPQRFSDVDPDDYFADAVEWMATSGITIGCGDGSRFCPDDTITRAQFMTLLWRALGSPEPLQDQSDRFEDVEPEAFYGAAVAWAADRGVTIGCGDGARFCPDDPLTRGQVASFLYRLSGQTHEPDEPSFSDVPETYTHYVSIEWMAQQQITTGCTVTTFCPDDPAARAHAAVFMYRYFNLAGFGDGS